MTKTLYVGNIPYKTTEEDLRNAFAAHVEVAEARVVVNPRTGRSCGYGFVDVPESEADRVQELMNGVELGGRQLRVAPAKAPKAE